MQHSLKLEGTNCHFKWYMVPPPIERPDMYIRVVTCREALTVKSRSLRCHEILPPKIVLHFNF